MVLPVGLPGDLAADGLGQMGLAQAWCGAKEKLIRALHVLAKAAGCDIGEVVARPDDEIIELMPPILHGLGRQGVGHGQAHLAGHDLSGGCGLDGRGHRRFGLGGTEFYGRRKAQGLGGRILDLAEHALADPGAHKGIGSTEHQRVVIKTPLQGLDPELIMAWSEVLLKRKRNVMPCVNHGDGF